MNRTAAHLSLLIACVSLLAIVPAPARAYVTLKAGFGYEIKWTKSSIPWYLHPNGSADVTFNELKNAMSAAFATWKATPCFSKSFSYGGTKTSDPQNGIFIKFMENSWDPTVGDAAAYAQTWKNVNGTITNGVVVFNGKDIVWSTTDAQDYFSFKSDVQGVGTHELGHCLGLGHSRHLEATMFFSGDDAELRTLEQDDKDGICYIYSNFSQGKPCDSCKSDNNCQSGYCLEYPDGFDYCGKNCTSDNNCPENTYCYDIQGGTDQCAAFNGYCNQQGGNIPIGYFCYGHATCETSLCLALPGDAYCSKECNSDANCPGSMKCISDYCIQGGSTPLGGSCENHSDCQTAMCMGIGGDNAVCTQECYSDNQCPGNFGCISGHCLGGGSTKYGANCDTDMECETVNCTSLGAMEDAICTKECEKNSDCPGNDPCTYELCVPPGNTPFGGDCQSHLDCQSGFCKGSGSSKYCSQFCNEDTGAGCPEGSSCKSGGFCSKISSVPTGECTSDSNCPSGFFCKMASQNDLDGQCVLKCNPFADLGCSENYECAWHYTAWTDTIAGECLPNNNGKGVGEECNLVYDPCLPNLVCINVGGGGPKCHKDCDNSSGLGCSSLEACLGLNMNNDPRHGVCVCNSPACQVQPDPDVVQQPEPEADVSVPVSPDITSEQDLYAPAPDNSGPGPGPGPEAGEEPNVPISKGGDGCSSTRSHASPAALPLMLLFFALLALRRRTIL